MEEAALRDYKKKVPGLSSTIPVLFVQVESGR
jgi:hypothetical protein